MEVQFDEHKLLFVYANDLEPVRGVLMEHGLRRDDSLKFISEAEHLHSTDDVYRDQFEELQLPPRHRYLCSLLAIHPIGFGPIPRPHPLARTPLAAAPCGAAPGLRRPAPLSFAPAKAHRQRFRHRPTRRRGPGIEAGPTGVCRSGTAIVACTGPNFATWGLEK
jgi:hypothetical protein